MRPARNTGLALIELLVVIGILLMLAALAVPVVARSLRVARLATCQARLHQWGIAFGVYAARYDNFYPHIDGLDRGKGPADQCGWVDVLPPLMGERPWREHEPRAFPGPDGIFQCPSAKLVDGAKYGYYPHISGYFSYAMNSCLELDANCWRAPGDGGIPMPSFLDRSKIKMPDRCILLFDQLLDPGKGYGGGRRNRSAGKHCGSYPKAFSARHRRGESDLGGSILHCDGHVSWVETVWKSHWPADLEVPPRDDRDWFPYW